ncbi:hypothetical protein C8Q80DRAFT_1119995 [Daedaleopsis nitida]|nr:hypothetical protein C8Q80DRAFT_1119995 [Daedaleopsis nitida]
MISVSQSADNYDDPESQTLTPPSLPENAEELDESELMGAIGLYHSRLVHFHYAKNTEEHNKLHHDALSDPVSTFIHQLFERAGTPWEGETHDLKALLIEAATETWGKLAATGMPCSVAFEPEDVRKTREFSERLQLADENFEGTVEA